MNKLIYKGNLNDFETFAGVGVTKGNWNERALKYFQYLGATSNSFNTAQKEIEESNLETLRLDFVNQDYAVGSADTGAVETKDTFDNILTFSRGSTGTYFDSAGVLQTAAVDEPRFTHDPDTLESEGLLIEEQRTNLLLRSEELDNAIWAKSNVTVSSTLSVIQGGQAWLAETNAGQPGAPVSQTAGTTSGSDETLSVIVEQGTSPEVSLGIRDDTAGIFYPLSTLTWSTLTATSGEVTPLGTGPNGGQLALFSISGNAGVSGNTRTVYLYPSNSSGIENPETNTIFHYAQLEQGPFPTSYIKTEASQVTRSADNCTRTLGDEYNSSEGRVVAVATNHTGEFILNLGTQSTLADVDTEKTYTLTYSSDPSATVLDLLSSGAGTVKSVKYYPREVV